MISSKQLTLTDITDNLYIMYYRHGTVPNKTKVFYNPPVSQDPKVNLLEARKRADKHCSKMAHHRLSTVTKFIVDLDQEEKEFGVAPPPNPLLTVLQEAQKVG